MSATLLAKQVKLQRRARGLEVYDGGLGESPLPAPKSMVETLRQFAETKEYTDANGTKELREAIGADNLVVGNGLGNQIALVIKQFLAFNGNTF